MSTITWSLQHKRDTAANFTSNNPVLLAGQLGIETDGLTTTPKFKIGDGVTAWTALPYFYGGASSAQNLNNVLGVGNTTGGANVVVSDDDIIQVGSTANRKIGFNTSTIVGGLELVNLNSNDHIILQDAGGIHIDTTYIQVPQVTASRILATDASNKITGSYTTTGSGTVLALSTSPTFVTDITTPKIIGVAGNVDVTGNLLATNSLYAGSTGTAGRFILKRAADGGTHFTIQSTGTTSASISQGGGTVSTILMNSAGISFQTENSTSPFAQASRMVISHGDSATITILDTTNFVFSGTTGTKLGTATTQKIGFWNATPIVQPTTAVAAATLVGGGGTTLTDTDTFDGYTLKQIVKALRNTGLLA